MSDLRLRDGSALKPQLEMIRYNYPVPEVPDVADGYKLRLVSDDDRVSYDQTFATAFAEPSPFNDMLLKQVENGFFVVEHLPSGSVVASSAAAVYPKAQHPDGHSLQWVVAHIDHQRTGAGQATIAAATEILAKSAPHYSYLSTDDFRLPAISIYLKLGWQPLLFHPDQVERWSRVFGHLGMTFNENDWPRSPK